MWPSTPEKRWDVCGNLLHYARVAGVILVRLAVLGLIVPVTETGNVADWPSVIVPIVQTVTTLFPPVALRVVVDPAEGAPYAEPVHAFDPPCAVTPVKFLEA